MNRVGPPMVGSRLSTRHESRREGAPRQGDTYEAARRTDADGPKADRPGPERRDRPDADEGGTGRPNHRRAAPRERGKVLTRQEHTRPGIVERTPEHLRAHLGRTSSSNAATWSRGFEQKERSLSRLIGV